MFFELSGEWNINKTIAVFFELSKSKPSIPLADPMTETPNYQRRSDPTPAEIAERCAEIRRDWSGDELVSRLRADLRPQYRRCDGHYETFAAADYETHHTQREKLQEAFGNG